VTDHVDPVRVHRPWFRNPKTIGAVAAVCVVGIGTGVGVAVLGGDDREIRMEVTSNSDRVAGINWRGPDDNNKIYELGGLSETIATPWTESIEVTSATGVVVLTARAAPGGNASCRLLVGDRVVAEQTGGMFVTCTISAQRAFPA
jgi:hypothetical protein